MTFVAVVGIGCGGTSAVAGILHKLGCPMGLPGHLGRHPGGFDLFEDVCFYGQIFRDSREPTQANKDKLRRLIDVHQQQPIWGIKNTLLGGSLPWVTPIVAELDEVRVVAVHRTLTASIKGRMAGRCPPGRRFSRSAAERWAMHAKEELLRGLGVVHDLQLAPIFHVGFEDLLKHPKGRVEEIAKFAFEGLTYPNGEKVKAAIAHLQPSLRHN